MTSFVIGVLFIVSAVARSTEWIHPIPIAQSSLRPEARISGGVDVDISQVPYTVAIETKGNKAQQFCAGALISDTHVLTACQCLIKPADKMRVRVGSSRRNRGGTVYEIAKHTCHPKFNAEDFDFDVGILHLETKVKLGDNVKIIKIGDSLPKNGTKISIAGWGQKEEEGALWPMLQKAEPVLMDWNECSDIYKMFMLSISERMMCTHGNGSDACMGDGGGPGVVNGAVVGVISWGLGCGRPYFPGVQTDVTHKDVRAFIRKETNV